MPILKPWHRKSVAAWRPSCRPRLVVLWTCSDFDGIEEKMGMSKKIRVVVVDDSALVRSLLSEIINRQRDMECVGTANDPLIAREMIRELNPDVITLDVEMPRMDGIDFLGRLMRLRPMPVVMISTLTEKGAEVTLRALELGAVDFVAKPRGVCGACPSGTPGPACGGCSECTVWRRGQRHAASPDADLARSPVH